MLQLVFINFWMIPENYLKSSNTFICSSFKRNNDRMALVSQYELLLFLSVSRYSLCLTPRYVIFLQLLLHSFLLYIGRSVYSHPLKRLVAERLFCYTAVRVSQLHFRFLMVISILSSFVIP